MRQLSPLAYVPRRATIQTASLGPVSLYLGAYLIVCFLSTDPLMLTAATAGAVVAGFSCGAGRAVRFSLKLGFFLLITMVVVNALVTSRGATVLARLGEWPILGRVDVTAEAIAAGGIIGLRALGTMVVIGVWSACVDPDRVLRAAHGVARRSALTATLVSRLVPLAAADQARLGEAARLRGPGATPVGRAAMANRLLAGSLDRAVDVAATLELRGYGLPTPRTDFNRIPSRYDVRFRIAGSVLMAVAVATIVFGVGELTAYPEISYSPDVISVGAAGLFLLGGFVARNRGG
ncbi:MAG: energy-coupling factor transporter transmembrane protein EcfT [Actinomycetota bacterium]|nr:energy-coupling factor transporter transmembrane protein EcfT [Actinomycetota bacterium]